MTVWHYTDFQGIQGILQSGYIRASTDNTVDAVYGEGVYATAMAPDAYSWKEIAKNNYDGTRWPSLKSKTDYALGIIAPDGYFKKIKNKEGRDIYLHQGDVHLKDVQYVIFVRD